MPVLRIHGLRPDRLDTPVLLQSCSAAVADAFDCPVEQCWTLFLEVQDGDYFEGGRLRTRESESHSPVAILSAYRGRPESQVATALRGVADCITAAYGNELSDVFVEYRELQPGQVFTGGEVR